MVNRTLRGLATAFLFTAVACVSPFAVSPSPEPTRTFGSAAPSAREDAVFVLRQAEPTRDLPVSGATLEDRGPVELLRLSTDARTVLSTTGTKGIGLVAMADGSVARLTPDPRNGVPTQIEFLDPLTLQTGRQQAIPPSSQVAVNPWTGAVGLVAPAGLVAPSVLRILSSDLSGSREVDLGAAVGRADCGSNSSLFFSPDGNFVMAGVCSTSPRGFFVLVTRPDGSRVVFETPANEYDSPYALSPRRDRLYVAKPSTSELWAMDLTAGAVVWRASYGNAIISELKRIGAPSALKVSPDGSTLYLVTSNRPGPGQGIRVFDAVTGRLKTTWLPETPITGVDLGENGSRLLVTSTNDGGSVIAVDTATGRAETTLRQLAVDGPGGRRNLVGIAVLAIH